jgi:hypothetical protein
MLKKNGTSAPLYSKAVENTVFRVKFEFYFAMMIQLWNWASPFTSIGETFWERRSSSCEVQQHPLHSGKGYQEKGSLHRERRQPSNIPDLPYVVSDWTKVPPIGPYSVSIISIFLFLLVWTTTHIGKKTKTEPRKFCPWKSGNFFISSNPVTNTIPANLGRMHPCSQFLGKGVFLDVFISSQPPEKCKKGYKIVYNFLFWRHRPVNLCRNQGYMYLEQWKGENGAHPAWAHSYL